MLWRIDYLCEIKIEIMSFESLGLSHNIIKSVKKLGFLKPFPIQEQTIPVILSGKDLMGIAQTGSGKQRVLLCLFSKNSRMKS